MVKVIGCKVMENSQGEEFMGLILQGGIEMVKSEETGRFYATAKKVTVPSTFDEETSRNMVGEQILGSIAKVPCEPYEYTIKESGEVITLKHRWEFVPVSGKLPEQVREKEEYQLEVQ